MNYYDIPAVSNSLIGEVKHQLLYNKPRFTKRSQKFLRFGRGLHTAILEPEMFDPHEFTGAERMEIIRMSNNFREAYPTIFDGCISFEKEYFWQYQGWKCKCKIDAVDHDKKILYDLKTTRATDAAEFAKYCFDYDYDRQAWWYMSVPELKDFAEFHIIGISKVNDKTFHHWYSKDDDTLSHVQEETNEILTLMEAMDEYKSYRA